MFRRWHNVHVAVIVALAGIPHLAAAAATPPVSRGLTDKIEVSSTTDQFPVAGNALDVLAANTPGEMSVVAYGPLTGNKSVSVIVRNRTGKVAEVEVGAEARDANGKLVGVGEGRAFYPPTIEPDALAIGTVEFGSPIPEGATVKFIATGGSSSDWLHHYSGIVLTEFSATASGSGSRDLIGTVRNPQNFPLEHVFLKVACFDASGTLTDVIGTKPVVPNLLPKGSAPFRASTRVPCDGYLVTGYGSH